MFFSEEKLRSRIDELSSYRYQEIKPIDGWRVREDLTKKEKYPPDLCEKDQPFTIGDHWAGRDAYLWLQTTVNFPETTEKLVCHFDLGKTGAGNNYGFEALLFIDDYPYQGVDSNHQEVVIEPDYYGRTVTLSLKLWSGLEGGGPETIQEHRFNQATLSLLNSEADTMYYTANAMLKTVSQLPKTNSDRYQLSTLLEESFILLDWANPGSACFYTSLSKANNKLQQGLNNMDKNELVTYTAIGHTHIDVAWLWQLKHTREKITRSFSTVLRLMAQYPEYIFLQTQPQLYDYLKKDYPEIYAEIKQLVAEGRWEVDGGMWLEADCNIPSGESLVRQILHGSRFVSEEFGKRMTYLWLPDVFGYSWALPQILKKSGIDTFMTTKISWNQINRMPDDTFYWRGIDGTEILTHFITTPEIDHDDHSDWYYTYNGHIEPETLLGSYEAYQNKELNSHLLLAYGYGDGGGGVTRNMLENRRALDRIPSVPNIKTGRADRYFKELHKTIEDSSRYVHTWDGELYLEYHRGTYTSQAYVKKMNRKLELVFRDLEILYGSALVAGVLSYPHKELSYMWEVLLRNQFHDIIPGSSIKEVYQDHRKEIANVELMIKELMTPLEKESKGTWTVINTLGWERSDLVEIKTDQRGSFETSFGKKLQSAPTANGYVVNLPLIPALGKLEIKIVNGEVKTEGGFAVIHGDGIETDFYDLKWNKEGQIVSLYDKENQRQVLTDDGIANQLFLYEDKPMKFDAWDIDIFYKEKGRLLLPDSFKVIEHNALIVRIEFNYQFGNSSIQQVMTLYKTNRRIDFETDVDWQERQQLLKASFEVAIRNTEATFDSQYGNVKRPTHWNTSWDMAKFETVAHQWVDFSETGYGVSLLNDSKYGHDIKDNVMSLTLLKGAIDPDPTADMGHHHFTYSLLPHKDHFISGKTVEEAGNLNTGWTILTGGSEMDGLFKLPSNQVLAIDAIKEAEEGEDIILRFHDHTGGQRVITLEPTFKYNQWWETNLLEEKSGVINHYDSTITLTLLPYEIRTLRFTRQ